METRVTVSSGDAKYEVLHAVGDALAEIGTLKSQVNKLEGDYADLYNRYQKTKKEIADARRDLRATTESGSLTGADALLLARKEVTLQFSLPLTGGVKLVVKGNRLRTKQYASKNESKTPLDEAMKDLRKED
jgi:hypothetical protein